MRTFIRTATLVALVLVLAGCGSVGGFGGFGLGSLVGGTSSGDATSNLEGLQKTGQAIQSASQEITPEQEYYIGRAVAANVLTIYKPWDNPRANAYINTLGEGLSLASILPETFSGYHFLIMDTDDINAFGAPSGFILVSRGLLRCATTEDEVAAILAHEIGHVSLKHGLKAISQGRWTEAALQIAKFAAQSSDSAILRSLTDSFGGVIGDIVKTMVTSGYSQDLEKQADLEAIRILHDVGYDPRALVRVLQVMKTRLKPDGKDFAKTHPAPEVRIAYLNDALSQQTPVAAAPAGQVNARQARYQAAMRGV
jgi:beta-barrel assembly-enhancing protease